MSVLFTVMGRDKKFVTTLRPEDVSLSVDGSPREILEMRRQTELPLFIAIVIDTSASQERVLPRTKFAADVFVRGMMAAQDRAAVLTFSGETTLEQPMTADVAKIREAIARVKFVPPPGYISGGILVGGPPYGGMPRAGSTGIWDAVYLTSDEVLSRSLGTGRRTLLLITDGVDTSSRLKIEDAVSSALQSEAVVYVVGVGDDKNFDGVEKGPVRKLAERTGGRAFFPKKVDEITDIFTQISEELLSQYVVTFADTNPARDGSFHKVKLEVSNRELRGQGVELAYPQGFYAGNAPTAVKK
jgi:VWFA-related protein